MERLDERGVACGAGPGLHSGQGVAVLDAVNRRVTSAWQKKRIPLIGWNLNEPRVSAHSPEWQKSNIPKHKHIAPLYCTFAPEFEAVSVSAPIR